MTFIFGHDPEAHDRAQAEVSSLRHIIEDTIQRMSLDELEAWASWMTNVATAPDVTKTLSLGIMAGGLSRLHAQKSKTCILCGEDHEAQLAELSGQDEVPPEVLEKIVAAVDAAAIEEQHKEADTTMSNIALAQHNYKVWLSNMVDYNLEETDGTDVRCRGCGKLYTSLADRMLKPVGTGGCSGCIDITKWG